MKLYFTFAAVVMVSVAAKAQCPGVQPSGTECVANGANKDITAFSTCAKISNSHASGKALLIPINSSSEWSTFRTKLPSGVTSGACGSALVYINEFSGFESATNLETYGVGTITCTTAATGNCSMQGGAAATNVVGNQDYMYGSIVTSSVRIMSSTTTAMGVIDMGSNANKAEFQWNTNGTTLLTGTGAPNITGPTIPRDGTWHYVNIEIDPSIGGKRSLWVDGVAYGSSTLTAAQMVDYVKVGGTGVYFDDVVLAFGAGPIGDMHVLARQGTAGTPTFNAFTKTGGATAAAVLSDTPYNSSTNISSSTSSAAQTMPLASFSPAITASNTIHACKTGMIALRGSGTSLNLSMIRYFNSATTSDGTITPTTSAAYYETIPYVTTLTDLTGAEVGVSRGASTQSTTIYDMWLSCVYTP